MMMITDARRSKGEPSASSPSEVPVSPAAAAIGLSRSVALSRGGSLLLGVLCAAGSRGHLVPRSRHGLGIAAGPCGISPSAVHGALARAASILPRAFRLLQRATACELPFVHQKNLTTLRRRKAPPMGFRSSSRHQPAPSTAPQDPHPRSRSVLGVSHVLDGFLRHRPCGFVPPRCHVQDLPCRGLSPPRGAVPAFAGLVMPSCRWTHRPAV